jgi:hypothetical protein
MAIPGAVTAASMAGVWLLAGLLVLGWRLARRRPLHAAAMPTGVILSAAVAATVYLVNSQRIIYLDSQPQVWAAVSLLGEGNFNLDEFRPAIDPILVQAITSPSGHIYSMYPPGSAFALVPFLVPARLAGAPLSLELLDATAKLAAALWTAASVGLLLAALTRYAPRGAWLAAFAYAFGTTAFSAAAQDLWQHGPSQAGLAAALAILALPKPSPRQEVGLGVALGWAVLCRTSNLLPALVLFAAGSRGRWGTALRAAAGAGPFALFTLAYNHATTGSPLLFAHTVHHGGAGFGHSLAGGLLALLFEPSRGLFVYSPFLGLAAVGVVGELRGLVGRSTAPGRQAHEPPLPPLGVVGATAALLLLPLVAQWEEWHGGWSYGYRIISEVALLLSPACAAALARWRGRRVPMAVAGTLVALSVGIHSLHVFAPDNGWNAAHLRGTAYLGMWNPDPRQWQIAWHLRAACQRVGDAPPAGAITRERRVPP